MGNGESLDNTPMVGASEPKGNVYTQCTVKAGARGQCVASNGIHQTVELVSLIRICMTA